MNQTSAEVKTKWRNNPSNKRLRNSCYYQYSRNNKLDTKRDSRIRQESQKDTEHIWWSTSESRH